jgi:hypothetical protein
MLSVDHVVCSCVFACSQPLAPVSGAHVRLELSADSTLPAALSVVICCSRSRARTHSSSSSSTTPPTSNMHPDPSAHDV